VLPGISVPSLTWLTRAPAHGPVFVLLVALVFRIDTTSRIATVIAMVRAAQNGAIPLILAGPSMFFRVIHVKFARRALLLACCPMVVLLVAMPVPVVAAPCV